MKVIVTGFVNTMSKPQRIAGFIYLPMHIAILPVLIGMFFVYVPIAGVNSSNTELISNITYYVLGLAFCLVAFWRYLRSAFDILLDNLGKNLVMIIFGYVIYTMLSYISGLALLALGGDALANPNNEELSSVAVQSYRATLALTVIIAPVVEECLFRGVLFGSIRTKNRVWAYAATMLLFAAYHVWQYVLVYGDPKLLLYAISYLPAGYALCWLYEKTNCIWMPIFLHMLINGVAMAAMQYV